VVLPLVTSRISNKLFFEVLKFNDDVDDVDVDVIVVVVGLVSTISNDDVDIVVVVVAGVEFLSVEFDILVNDCDKLRIKFGLLLLFCDSAFICVIAKSSVKSVISFSSSRLKKKKKLSFFFFERVPPYDFSKFFLNFFKKLTFSS
jgi:hypothetical protein